MAYVSAEARRQLLDEVEAAVDDVGLALGALGEAYEQLDDHTADVLEQRLFRPVQGAYGRAQRTAAGFAERHGLTMRAATAATPHAGSTGVRALVDEATAAVRRADDRLSSLQDSMLPVEVGDPELRAGLADVRTQLASVAAAARELLRGLGR
jgi:hypothetical protein